MNPSIKSITVATLFAASSPMIALAQADVSVDASGGASTAAGDAGAAASASANATAAGNPARGSGTDDAGNDTYGRLIAGLRTGTLAETDEFSEYEIGTDGEAEILALGALQGDGAENGVRALENAIAGTGIDADYDELPKAAFDDSDYDRDDVVAAYFDADGNLVIVVDGAS